jgi:threonine dehydrogenase-like Zn-dependent dehydrogenase
MKAWRLYGMGDIRLDEIPEPKVMPGSVLVKTRMVQPSITEVQLMQGVPLIPDWGKMLKEKVPFQAFGHEFSAEIIDVGERVENLKVGDRVFFAKAVPCGDCALCKAGYSDRCRRGPILGIDIPGCFAEYAVLPAGCLIRIPDSIGDSEATAMQPLASVLEFIIAAKIEAGDTIAVLGQGVMGINCMQVSRAYGAGRTIVTDLREESLVVSRDLGADIVINASERDPVSDIMEATNGVGVDIVFDCAGGSPKYNLSGTKTFDQASRVVRDGGKIVLVGVLDSSTKLEASPVIWKGVQYIGPGYFTNKDLDYLITLVASKRIKLIRLVTHILEGLDKAPEAFEITGNKIKHKALGSAQVRIAQ